MKTTKTKATSESPLQEFRAPAWATDWCARCEWAQTCTDCRAGWTC